MKEAILNAINKQIKYYERERGERKYRDFGTMTPEYWDYLDGIVYGLEQAKISVQNS